MTLDLTLLPDYSKTRAEASFDYSIINYIESKATMEMAVAFARLFAPEFVSHRGCVIRLDGFDAEVFEKWWNTTGGDPRAIELAMNLVHIPDLIPSDTSDLDDRVIDYLGETLAALWQCRVNSLFPKSGLVARYEKASDDRSAATVLLARA